MMKSYRDAFFFAFVLHMVALALLLISPNNTSKSYVIKNTPANKEEKIIHTVSIDAAKVDL